MLLLGSVPKGGDKCPLFFLLPALCTVGRPDGWSGSSHLGPGSNLRSIGPARWQNKIRGAWVPDAVKTHTSVGYLGELNCLSDCSFGVSSLAGHPNSN